MKKSITYLICILLGTNIIFGMMLFNSMVIINEQNQWIEDELDGKHDPIAYPIFYAYFLDKEHPSRLISIEDGVKRNITLRPFVTEECITGPRAYLEWWILNYTIVTVTDPFVSWVEYTDWILIYEGLPQVGTYSEEFDITLFCKVV